MVTKPRSQPRTLHEAWALSQDIGGTVFAGTFHWQGSYPKPMGNPKRCDECVAGAVRNYSRIDGHWVVYCERQGTFASLVFVLSRSWKKNVTDSGCTEYSAGGTGSTCAVESS